MWRRIGYIVIMINFILTSFVFGEGPPELTGYTGLSYTETFPGNNSDNSWSQSLSLRWKDQMYRNKVTLGLDLLLNKTSGEDFQVRHG